MNVPENITIFAEISLSYMLEDKRPSKKGLVFGKVSNVAKQYGIEFKTHMNGVLFAAPKSRLQIFVEKLHFSGINYVEI